MVVSTADLVVLVMELERYKAEFAPVKYIAREAVAWEDGVRLARNRVIELLQGRLKSV